MKTSRKPPEELTLLNAEQIAARRVPLEDSVISESKAAVWYCDFCKTRFVQESRFLKHRCKSKERYNKLRSPIGQAALSLYREWMRLKQFGQPSSDAFQQSRYFKAFIKFSEFIQAASISRPEKYIELMIAGDIDPWMWCSPRMYATYIKWFDSLQPPLEQVHDSISLLLDISEKEDVALIDIFKHLGHQRTLQLIRQRRLSPWFLFCSSSFLNLVREFDTPTLKAFNDIVSASFWQDQFKKNRALRDDIKLIIGELNL